MNFESTSPKPEEKDGKGPSQELLNKAKELANTGNLAELVHQFEANGPDGKKYAIVLQTFGKTFIGPANPTMNIAVVEITDTEKPKDSDHTFFTQGQHKMRVDEWRQTLAVQIRADNWEQRGRVIACLNRVVVKLQPRQLAEFTNALENSIKGRLSLNKDADLSSLHNNLKIAAPALEKGAMAKVRGALGG